MTEFNFDIDISDAQYLLDAINAKLVNLTPEYTEIATNANSEIQKHLFEQKNPNGSIYLSPKAEQRRALIVNNNSYGRRIKTSVTKDGVSITSDHPGIRTHELGLSVRIFGRTPPYKFPQRSAIWFSPKTIKSWADVIKRGF